MRFLVAMLLVANAASANISLDVAATDVYVSNTDATTLTNTVPATVGSTLMVAIADVNACYGGQSVTAISMDAGNNLGLTWTRQTAIGTGNAFHVQIFTAWAAGSVSGSLKVNWTTDYGSAAVCNAYFKTLSFAGTSAASPGATVVSTGSASTVNISLATPIAGSWVIGYANNDSQTAFTPGAPANATTSISATNANTMQCFRRTSDTTDTPSSAGGSYASGAWMYWGGIVLAPGATASACAGWWCWGRNDVPFDLLALLSAPLHT